MTTAPRKLTPVPSHVSDPSICQAVVLSSAGRQCCAKATTKRDGYPCCNRHKNARWFVVWTPLNLMSAIDASRHYGRVMEELRGRRAPRPRLVK
jgi:hypothetical protein